MSAAVKVGRSASAVRCQSRQALQTGSTDLLCGACTFQAEGGVKEQTRRLQDYRRPSDLSRRLLRAPRADRQNAQVDAGEMGGGCHSQEQ